MRSRDGNRTLSLFICGLIFFHTQVFCAEEYLISYRYVVQDARLYNESLEVARAMKSCEGKELEPFVLSHGSAQNFKDFLLKNSAEFIEYLHKLGLHVEHREQLKNYATRSQTILTLRTMCFKVDFNDSLAIIIPLK